MVTALKNSRSLTFYQNIPVSYSDALASAAKTSINSAIITDISMIRAARTTGFNNQLNTSFNNLHPQRDALTKEVAEGLANDPSYQGSRSKSVNLAWKYEQADVQMGGKGSANWTKEQQQEILKTGKVRGQEGHHINNVADHPADQGNPDNIEFLDRQKHQEKHGGDFRNETHGSFIDKDKMLKTTNFKRVFRNELTGVGLAAAIGAGVGFTIGFTVSLAQSGISPESIKNAFASGGKAGMHSGIQSVFGYGIGRTVGLVAQKALEGVLENIGIEITDNISKMCGMGAIGFITITIFCTYEFIKLRQTGISTKDALIKIGKQALFSLSLLALSIAAQGIWGGPAGLIVSVSSGIIFITVNIGQSIHNRKLADSIKVYTIEKAEPLYSVA